MLSSSSQRGELNIIKSAFARHSSAFEVEVGEDKSI